MLYNFIINSFCFFVDIRLFNRILIRAEVFKQKHRNWNEQNIVVYAIESVCRCIFSAEDWFLFKVCL